MVYLYALGSNFCFALGSQVFTHFSRSVSSVWMNTIKALVATVAFGLTFLLIGESAWPGLNWAALFVLSGALGLGLGDWLLLSAFREIGPGRTMILFGFQPLIMGALSYLVFGQEMNAERAWGILFFILCLVTISRESFRRDRSYGVKGVALAFAGMSLDAVGAILSRSVFDAFPAMGVFEGNFYRCLGALAFFGLFSLFRPIHLVSTLKKQTPKAQLTLLFGSLLGTYISLSLFMKALQSAHLASLSGIAITGTIFSSGLECLIKKEWPSRSLLLAFVFFMAGMAILLRD